MKNLLGHFMFFRSGGGLSYTLTLGFVLAIFIFLQIFSGFVLNSNPSNYTFYLKYFHTYSASLIILVMFLHVYKNIYINSCKGSISKISYFTGVLLFLLLLFTCFTGYLLPWGSMSFWGTKVILNFLDYLPLIGATFKSILYGGNEMSINFTVSRFKALHIFLAFTCILLLVLHIIVVHNKRTSNLPYSSLINNHHNSYLYPTVIYKDIFILFLIILFVYIHISINPYFCEGYVNNLEPLPLITPDEITPEWYFLPNFSVLKYLENKKIGFLICLPLTFIVLITLVKKRIR